MEKKWKGENLMVEKILPIYPCNFTSNHVKNMLLHQKYVNKFFSGIFTHFLSNLVHLAKNRFAEWTFC